MLRLSSINIHSSWHPLFDNTAEEIAEVLAKINAASIDGQLCPQEDLIFRFASFDLSKLQVVILGQDPYPQPGAATGRSFEVGTLTDWAAPFRQTSLRNLLRAIYRAETGEEILWTALRKKIADGAFPILPPDKLFGALEAQGVLFLNTYLTCLVGKPLSHEALWRPFSEKLIAYIDTQPNAGSVSWFLWGSHARSYGPLIKNGIRYESRHPMLCGNFPDDFLKNPCFGETRDRIDWTGGGKS